jgi:hypothetical protein
MVAGDDQVLNFIKKSYEFTTSMGISKIGFIDCYPAVNDSMEGCALGDLIGMAIRLSDCGMGDYWDDVDACVRNQLAESQLLDAAQLTRIAESSPAYGADHYGWPAFPIYNRQGSYENVIQRSLGLFGSNIWPTSIPETWIMQCCTGNAVNGLYYAWEGILRENGETATVNLLLNRAGRLVDIDSWIPYEGKVEIINKHASRILVRIPGWVKLSEVAFFVESGGCSPIHGAPQAPVMAGRYAIFDAIQPGSILRLTFPIKEYEASYTVSFRTHSEKTHRIQFRGSTVVDISDKDKRPTSYHLYLRDELKSGGPTPMDGKASTTLRELTRFVADKVIRNW